MRGLLNIVAVGTLAMAVSSCTYWEQFVGQEAGETASSIAANAVPEGNPATEEVVSSLLPYESFELDNGLTVIFHIDRSDPVVAVSLTAHVGSAREVPGRTGFAHLFEHLLFLESENLGKGGLDQMSARIGGSGANGFTSRDQTTYFQTVPNNALEKMLWAEADKLGWFINTVTDPVLAKEKQVVKNEKRQSYDNRAYGHMFSVLRSSLYPEDHPYHWEVIGSLEDVQAATLDDVKAFYGNWYKPNNVTLVVAGDFDTDKAKGWVHKYFDEIPSGPDVDPLPPRAGELEVSLSFYHEDNFAEQPRLAMLWPAVPDYHPDSYALDILSAVLTDGKRAPLNEVLIDEEKLTSEVIGFAQISELAGEFALVVTGFDGVDLDAVKAGIDAGFDRFEANGISEDVLQRIKIEQEVAFYSDLQSVLGKSTSLAEYAIFAGDPGFVDRDLARLQAVTVEDVMRVYRTYIQDQPFVVASFVPKGEVDLALEGAVKADIVEEAVATDAGDAVDPSADGAYEPTPSTFDRSIEPPAGPVPVLQTPAIWEQELSNGLQVFGIEDTEIPLVQFSMSIAGGHLMDTVEKNGAANLVAEMMTRGTANRTPADLQELIASLGADISVRASNEALIFRGEALARNFEPVMALLTEMILEPRWDSAEFELAKAQAINEVIGQRADPVALAELSADYVMYGADDIRAHGVSGSQSSLTAMDVEDLKAFYAANFSPSLTSFRIVGDVEQAAVLASLETLQSRWTARDVAVPALERVALPDEPAIFFYDVPGAKQSVLLFQHPGLLRTEADYFPATVSNYILGGGGFASRLTQQLREGKGYTYGIFSTYDASARDGTFEVSSRVRSNVTYEATDLIKSILEDYDTTYTEDDLAVTKSFFLNSKARQFESFRAKLGLLANIDHYDLPYDYVAEESASVMALSVDDVRDLAGRYVLPGHMNYVIVGDAETQLDKLADLGLGDVMVVTEAVNQLME
ncbi:MAG: pitrilysin family protein [Pseudomonadota bacterium]